MRYVGLIVCVCEREKKKRMCVKEQRERQVVLLSKLEINFRSLKTVPIEKKENNKFDVAQVIRWNQV